MERNKESQNAALLDLQNEMKSLKSLFISRASATTNTNTTLEQVSSAPATPAATPAAPVAAPAVSTPTTEGLSSRLSATLNGTGARAGIPAWQMAASSANNTTSPAAESEASGSK